MINLKIGDKVYATKDYYIYATKGEEFEVVYIGGGVMKLKSTDPKLLKIVWLDSDLYKTYFTKVPTEKQKPANESNVKTKTVTYDKHTVNDNVKSYSKPVNETVDEEQDDIITVTEDDVINILENSDISFETVYDRCTVVTCKLPNGFIITESSVCYDKDEYDEDYGVDRCMEKISDKVLELEAYRLMANAYEDGWFEDEDEGATCDNCDMKYDCADSPYFKM